MTRERRRGRVQRSGRRPALRPAAGVGLVVLATLVALARAAGARLNPHSASLPGATTQQALVATTPAPASGTVRGVLTDLQAGSLGGAGQFTLRTNDGRELTFQFAPGFRSAPDHPMSPGHLRVHLTTGDPVSVTYIDQQGVLLATMITD